MAPDRRFTFVPLSELPPPPPRVEIIEGLLAAGEMMLLTGAPGSGKSALAVYLAACVEVGRDVGTRRVSTGPVAYLALEKAASIGRRLDAAGAGRGTYMIAGRPALDLVSDADRLISGLAEIDPALIVIDTAARAMPDIDENSSRDIGRAMRGVAAIQAAMPGAAIVLVHHTEKSGTSARGSSALLAAADLELRVERTNAGDDLRIAKVTKANDIAEGQRLAFRLGTAIRFGQEILIATPCDVPAERRDKAAKALGDQNAKRRADAEKRDGELLSVLPERFAPDDAVAIATTAGLWPDVKPDSRRRSVTRTIGRLVESGGLARDGDGFKKVSDVRTDVGHTVSYRVSDPSDPDSYSDTQDARRTDAGQAWQNGENLSGHTGHTPKGVCVRVSVPEVSRPEADG